MVVASAVSKILKEKIKNLPDTYGVYLFKNKRDEVIYIGKAKSIRKRGQSYFNRPLDYKTQIMASKIADVEYIITPSEAQAQIQEAALIKDKRPYYNISLKDDKSFPLIRITREDFPVVSICRRKNRQKKDTSFYFGPFTNAEFLRQSLKIIRKVFGFRSCKKMPKRACLYYRLHLCPAPCIGRISVSRYKEIINQIRMFLESRQEELLDKLSAQMKEATQKKRFEEAAKIRDQIKALSSLKESKISFSNLDELEGLKNLLNLNKLPKHIEAFDISNVSGKDATGSLVSFYRGLPDKNNYRRFRIKSVKNIDDYQMLREVIQRRYSRLIKENLSLPDLILIDGGRSHLLTADKEVKKLGLNIPLASIAKGRENIYILSKPAPIQLSSDTAALNLIRKIRDEAHRFALAYHHILRRKKIIGK